MHVVRITVAISALSSLTACHMGADVTVEQESGTPHFTVTKFHSSKPACIEQLDLYPTNSPDQHPIWTVYGGHTTCPGQFDYGRAPAGFSADPAPAPKLVPGQEYQVDVSGSGYLGGTTFVAQAP